MYEFSLIPPPQNLGPTLKNMCLPVASLRGLQGIQRRPWNAQMKKKRNSTNETNLHQLVSVVFCPCTVHLSGFVLEKNTTNYH